MYIKTLTALTTAFLVLLMVIMMGTAPQTLAFNTGDSVGPFPNDSHHLVECEKPLSLEKTSLRQI